MIVDYALYTNGSRVAGINSIADLHIANEKLDSFAWIGLSSPNESELKEVLGNFRLHEVAYEDALQAKQRAKFEEFENINTFVLRTVFYDEQRSSISTGEIICFFNQEFIIIIRHGDGAQLATVRRDLEQRTNFLRLGPYAVLHAVIDRVIDEYTKIAIELEKDVVAIETEVFSNSRRTISQKIYSLKREVIEYRHAIEPLISAVQRIVTDPKNSLHIELRPHFRDIQDQVSRACEHASGLDALLTAALQADLAQVQVQQNEDVRRISSWVALASVPTMVAGIYGMNFENMPELRWRWGYPTVLVFLVIFSLALFRKFRKSGWL